MGIKYYTHCWEKGKQQHITVESAGKKSSAFDFVFFGDIKNLDISGFNVEKGVPAHKILEANGWKWRKLTKEERKDWNDER